MSLVAHAAVRRCCRRRRPGACSSSPSRPSSPATAPSIPSRAACRARSSEHQGADLGPLVPPGRRVARAAAARVMNGAEDRPLLVLDRKGKGRVALLLSDHAWLWARGYEGGGPHTDLLRRLAHWLMKEPDLEEERLIASAKGLKLTIERRSMEESVPRRAGLGAGRRERPRSTLEKAGPGPVALDRRCQACPASTSCRRHRRPGQLTAVAHAGIEDAREMSEVTATDAKLKPLVEATGGGAFWTRGGGLLSSVEPSGVDVPRISMLANARVLAGSGWMGLKDREAFVTRGVKLIPMFTGFLALAALLALMALAWWREGR